MNLIMALWKKIPTNIKIYAVGIIVIVALFMYYNWKINSLEAKLAVSEGDVAALKDTVRVTHTKNGELESAKLALLADKSSLQKLSDSLDREVKKEKGSVKYIVSSQLSIKHDTIKVASHVIDSSILWAYDHEDSCGSRHLAGVSTKTITTITRDELSLNLITGLKERDDKKMEIFIRSKYPGISFGKIEGAIIDPMKPAVAPPKRWFSFGPCASIIIDPTGTIRYGIGASIQLSVLRF